MSAPATGPQMTQPGAMEVFGWQQRRNAAQQNYADFLAQNQYQQGTAQRRYNQGAQDYARQVGQARSTFGDTYAQRGIFGSGLYQRGLRNFYNDVAGQQANMSGNYLDQMGMLNLQAQQGAGSLANQLTSIEQEEMARRADLAAQIRGVM